MRKITKKNLLELLNQYLMEINDEVEEEFNDNLNSGIMSYNIVNYINYKYYMNNCFISKLYDLTIEQKRIVKNFIMYRIKRRIKEIVNNV